MTDIRWHMFLLRAGSEHYVELEE